MDNDGLIDDAEAPKASRGIIPKMMFLTNSKTRIEAYRKSNPRSNAAFATRMYVDFDSDLSTISHIIAKWLNSGSPAALDGLYMEYDANTFNTPSKRAKFADLCKNVTVGVWGNAKEMDPDTAESAKYLIEQGVRFVNTDLPLDFNN